jgi:hypothetical protein
MTAEKEKWTNVIHWFNRAVMVMDGLARFVIYPSYQGDCSCLSPFVAVIMQSHASIRCSQTFHLIAIPLLLFTVIYYISSPKCHQHHPDIAFPRSTSITERPLVDGDLTGGSRLSPLLMHDLLVIVRSVLCNATSLSQVQHFPEHDHVVAITSYHLSRVGLLSTCQRSHCCQDQ